MREVVLDTETTGVSASNGDRIVEIGAVEVLNAIPTGNTFHVYLNPERDMPDDAFQVHGLSASFLADKPLFAQIADEFVQFLGQSKLVAHNADFDVGFLNRELGLCGRPAIGAHQVVDTLALARRKHSGAPNSLDALCARYAIDASRRTKHGALLDAELLAEIYLELTGGRQAILVLAEETASEEAGAARRVRARSRALVRAISAAERAAHAAFMTTFADPIWARVTRMRVVDVGGDDGAGAREAGPDRGTSDSPNVPLIRENTPGALRRTGCHPATSTARSSAGDEAHDQDEPVEEARELAAAE